MKLIDLIKSNNWLSLQSTFLSLYPDEETLLAEYKNVFENLQNLESINMDLEIVLTKIGSEDSDFYIDVSGCERNHDQNSSPDTYSLASTKWNEWLGMNISQNTLDEFDELEIISHCLYEMTFFAFDEDEIQEQIASIEKSMEEYKELNDEEKKSQTVNLDELVNNIEKDQDVN
ncbi:MAG: DUF6557 family protein [Bacteroidia bacterium]